MFTRVPDAFYSLLSLIFICIREERGSVRPANTLLKIKSVLY